MDRIRLTFLFHRYVNNNCTEAEKEEFLNFVDDPMHDPALTALLDRLWMQSPAEKIPPSRAELILNQILESEKKVVLHTRSYPFWMKVAASIVLMIVCGGALFYYFDVDQTHSVDAAFDKSEEIQPRFITFPDGSSVVLNAGSTLDFPESFSSNERQVSLTGEGYFDIAHDPARPFVVHTGKLKTTVLGTAFNIKAYPDQSDIVVTVTRGKVKVSDDKKILGIINPDQQLTFNRRRDYLEHKVVDAHTVTSWMEKDIFFDDITIGNAVDQLEKRFGISITMTNERIRDCRFTATFVRGEDIGQILRILCDFNNARLFEDGADDFIIQGGECPL